MLWTSGLAAAAKRAVPDIRTTAATSRELAFDVGISPADPLLRKACFILDASVELSGVSPTLSRVGKHRKLMGAGYFSQHRAPCEDILQQGIVIKHVDRPRPLAQRTL